MAEEIVWCSRRISRGCRNRGGLLDKTFKYIYCTAKRQSHHSPVSFQTPQWRRRIQYVISLSSLMVLPTLNAHATRPKILENFAKFHWISPFCMVKSRKKQCYVSIFCCALQCNRGTETIYLEPSKLSLDMSNLHGRATRRVVLESSFAQHFPMDSRRSYTKRWTLLFARYHKPSRCHLQSSAQSNRARYQAQKSANFQKYMHNTHMIYELQKYMQKVTKILRTRRLIRLPPRATRLKATLVK